MVELKEKHCEACDKATEPLKPEEIKEFKAKLKTDWVVVDNKKIRKEYPFDGFMQGMTFAHEIAKVAEEENHHPDLCIHFSSVEVEIHTHKIGGLTESDFILAAKIEAL